MEVIIVKHKQVLYHNKLKVNKMHGLDMFNIYIYNSFCDVVSKSFTPNCECSLFVSSLFSCGRDGWTESPPLHPFLLKPHSLCMSDAFILPQQFVQPNLAIIYHYHNFGRKSIGSIRLLGPWAVDCLHAERLVAPQVKSIEPQATADYSSPPALALGLHAEETSRENAQR